MTPELMLHSYNLKLQLIVSKQQSLTYHDGRQFSWPGLRLLISEHAGKKHINKFKNPNARNYNNIKHNYELTEILLK